MSKVKIEVELSEEMHVYVTNRLSHAHPHSIEIETEQMSITLKGTKSEIIKFEKDLKDSSFWKLD